MAYLRGIKRAFSLIEVLAATAILSVSLITTMALFSTNIRTQVVNREHLTASLLAQEGLEVTRNYIDQSKLFPVDGNYFVQYDHHSLPPKINNVTSSDDKRLFLTTGTEKYYTHIASGNTESIFRRDITITNKGTEYVTVRSVVQWNVNGQDYTYEAQTDIYAWRNL